VTTTGFLVEFSKFTFLMSLPDKLELKSVYLGVLVKIISPTQFFWIIEGKCVCFFNRNVGSWIRNLVFFFNRLFNFLQVFTVISYFLKLFKFLKQLLWNWKLKFSSS
jgi:hypothetical protein